MSGSSLPATPNPHKRCAVYCRVSSDERLDQEFNSIDAQREAGHAYIASQRAEGWIPVPDEYEDPGFSGGNTERPALKRLLADIDAGKIAASKRKGLWMGGVPPLGYDVVNRQLVVNVAEAAIVRRIFEEMLTDGSPTRIAAAMTAEGITTKSWTTRSGQLRAGSPMDKRYLYKLLRNRLYLGEIAHQGTWYPGVHQAIIDPALWEKVDAVLATDAHKRAGETKARSGDIALLRGMLYTHTGDLMRRTYTSKNGHRYHYYAARSENRYGTPGKISHRVPAQEIEAAVVSQIRAVLTSPDSMLAPATNHLQANGAQLNDMWEKLSPVDRHHIACMMIERIDLVHIGDAQGINVSWRDRNHLAP